MGIYRSKNLFYLMLAFCLSWMVACKEDPGEEQDQKKNEVTSELTSQTWVASKVTHEVDGDVSTQFENLIVAFSTSAEDEKYEGSYTAQNGGAIFPSTEGQWRFLDENYDAIERADGVVMQIKNVSNNSLVLDIEVPAGAASARMQDQESQYQADDEDMAGEQSEVIDTTVEQEQAYRESRMEGQQTQPVPEEGEVNMGDIERGSRTASTSGTFTVEFVPQE
jgi:hypothetical protein